MKYINSLKLIKPYAKQSLNVKLNCFMVGEILTNNQKKCNFL